MFSGTWSIKNGELGEHNFNYLCELLSDKSPLGIQAGIDELERSGTCFKPSFPELVKLCSEKSESKLPCHNMINVDFVLPDHSKSKSQKIPDVFMKMKAKLANANRSKAS